MISEQQIIAFMGEDSYKPMTYRELEKHFGLEGAEDFKHFVKLLVELEEQGKLLRATNERYGLPERMGLVRGRLQAHAKGFAFLIPEDREHPDVYIGANDLRSAMNGDTVLVKVTKKDVTGGRMEGEVEHIITRAVTQVVGILDVHESFSFVLPDDNRINKDIFIPKSKTMGGVSGQKVVVKIVTYPDGRSSAEGEVIEILGHVNDPGVDILSIIRKHELPEQFPDDVMDEATAAPDTIAESEIKEQKRRDLRGEVIVTIDGADAKDLDDAVHVKRLENGNYVLGVHIADVGYYVPEKSLLDQEAYKRGCSVYLVDRVIPMLPHRLSNGICSLNPKVDRFTLSCEMEFEAGTLKRVRHDIFTSVIRTTERMTYADVRKLLEADEENPELELMERYGYLQENFKTMEVLARGLRKKRMQRGAIDFDFDEAKILVDENGKPTDIVKRERTIAESVIEEFMLAANETVAEHFFWLKSPFLYRIHEEPDQEKLMKFMTIAANFGHTVKGTGNTIHPKALQALLAEIDGTKEATVISTMMLRSMKQAKYDPQSLGHYGLAAEFYSHFTSPIRRYPDLVIHRIIRETIDNGGQLSEKRQEALHARMADIAQQSSQRERIAVEAERDVEKLKKCEYMLDKVGQEFDGVISSVTSFGIFIELDNTVEGLIRMGDLTDDYYHFHEDQMVLIGERTSNAYRIGDEVKIIVKNVNMNDHTIDFQFVGQAADKHSRYRSQRGGTDRENRRERVLSESRDNRNALKSRDNRASGGRRANDSQAAVGFKKKDFKRGKTKATEGTNPWDPEKPLVLNLGEDKKPAAKGGRVEGEYYSNTKEYEKRKNRKKSSFESVSERRKKQTSSTGVFNGSNAQGSSSSQSSSKKKSGNSQPHPAELRMKKKKEKAKKAMDGFLHKKKK